MKKTLCLILALVMAFGCFSLATPVTANAQSFTTENGVKVEIADFLYKSALYQMEFPSHQSYEIKEKSAEGDYAISRELNDMSYTFVFPAGTTKIECLLSLDGENNWRGFRINSVENPNYWIKDADGNIDPTQPLTFKRDEVTAECDEYGVQYRDFLLGTGAKGFKDIDKIYWKLIYTCNGTEITEYFDIKLYDYDASEKYTVKAVNFNVAGLPFAALQGEDVKGNQKVVGKYLSNNAFDIVAVQEDFGYHKQLVGAMSGFGYSTTHTGSIPGGDGLNVFTTDMPMYNETREPWDVACGILSDGSDELTPKGFVYTVIDIGNGIYVDFYNLHADAYGGEGSKKARTSQFKQLAEFIQARSAENDRPVIVTGDFNYHIHTHEDNGSLYKSLYEQCGLKDAWVEFHNNGDYYNMYNWHISGLPAWGNWDSVERFMYKSGGGVDLVVSDFRYVTVTDDSGKVISDHNAAECDFTFIKTSDFVENTQEFNSGKVKKNDFIHNLMWFLTALFKVFSDLGNLSSLLGELT
jgi:exonuclease III